MEENLDWRKDNEAYQRNRRRRIRNVLILAAVIVGFALLAAVQHFEDNGYKQEIDNYYSFLNSGNTVWLTESHAVSPDINQKLTEAGWETEDIANYVLVVNWQETLSLKKQYGDFGVQYRIISKKRLGKDELEKYGSVNTQLGGFVKGYRVKVSEHFSGDKDELVKQELLLFKTEDGSWKLLPERLEGLYLSTWEEINDGQEEEADI
ncbi:hypothetical protein SAMN02910447_00852 [Ruminococcus sp. YE71]|uniref:hypothetical protein n=1 Tax=unclassified Ruminococcus TaxID=2608920 RepID=UPI00087E2E96|nr:MULTISPECIES: hypothetical protein [unclassified Ruminococcus]SDA14494.1 hypothetical protein SAMN02910446_00851 [Ruminococcus sp. YE78]SFW21113.1 hypothetical protein SAMN02910447_00852 [Ruminococcus sp. YE71]